MSAHLRRHSARRSSARNGAYALEFALALPVLLALITGAMDWSWYIYQTSTVSEAAWQGARIGAGITDEEEAETTAAVAVQQALASMNLSQEQQPEISAQMVQEGSHQVLEVTVSIPYAGTFGIVPMPGTMEGNASAVWYGDI